jgi:hypothetical protein
MREMRKGTMVTGRIMMVETTYLVYAAYLVANDHEITNEDCFLKSSFFRNFKRQHTVATSFLCRNRDSTSPWN